ncbi:glycosyltransferase family 8 protein [Paracoccus homiensis]|uniref:glycosyltransferase family 8 protein n=1 Tax=Paracoccus homiensis TaxID=364199 RepID=UPI00398CCED0
MAQSFSVAFVTDKGLFQPTLRAAHSAIAHAAQPLRILFVGYNLTGEMWHAVERMARLHPTSDIVPTILPPEWLADATSPKSFITPTALGRMFLPRISEGRVLYIDGDTLITQDICSAAHIDMNGNPLAAVRDYAVMRWRAVGKTDALRKQAAVVHEKVELTDYVNSGVLLLDCDAIRRDPMLLSQMEDMKAATGYPTVDQDRINLIFSGRITHLDPAWNCSWGRLARQRRFQAGLPTRATLPRAAILHFHGPNKPWQPWRLSSLKKGPMAVWRYRRDMAAFDRAYASKA